MKRFARFWLTVATVFFSSQALLWAHEGHEHTSNSPAAVAWGFEGVKGLANLHPLFVHMPIALLLVSPMFYLLGLVFKKEHFFKTGQWSLYFGALSAGAAVWTGLQAASTVPHDGTTHPTMMTHQYLGITLLVLSAVLCVWLIVSKTSLPKPRVAFLGGLFLVAALIFQQADFGGRLVFFHGVGVGRKNMAADGSRVAAPEAMSAKSSDAHDHGSHAH